MTWYNLAGDLDDDLTNINIPKSEGMHEVEGSGSSSNQFLKALKIKKVNIGSPEIPKFSNMGDCWNDEIATKITELLHEF